MENWRQPYICVEEAQFYMASSDWFSRRFGGAAFYINFAEYYAQLRLDDRGGLRTWRTGLDAADQSQPEND
jgi:hypothetical protein